MATLPELGPLTGRQQREIAYHRDHADLHADIANMPVATEVITQDKRRWWNAYWRIYTVLRRDDWQGKKVLIPGSGFGDDAIRFAKMGAEVEAFDLSPEIVEIARARCAKFGYRGVNFEVMPSERLIYPDNTFDAAFFHDILHHVDIAATLTEVRRVLKPGAKLIGIELYTHSVVERVMRHNPIVERFLYPNLRRFIYGTDRPYITEDEHKIDESEFTLIRDCMDTCWLDYFNVLTGRILPDRWDSFAKFDRILARMLGGLGWLFAGRILFWGTLHK